MRSSRLIHEASFDFVLSDEQRLHVESALEHDGVKQVRWVPYPMKRFDTVVVEFRALSDSRSIARAVTFVASKLQCLGESLEAPVRS